MEEWKSFQKLQQEADIGSGESSVPEIQDLKEVQSLIQDLEGVQSLITDPKGFQSPKKDLEGVQSLKQDLKEVQSLIQDPKRVQSLKQDLKEIQSLIQESKGSPVPNIGSKGSPVSKIYPIGRCFFPLSLSMILQILRAGPSFNPRYFIIILELRSNRAFPTIKQG